MKYLITGGCGFLGTNLSTKVLKRKEELIVFDNLSRLGSKNNLDYLKGIGNFEFVQGDIRTYENVKALIQKGKPDVIFHLAGQVAMTTSIENPILDFETNAKGSLFLLDCVRKYSPNSTVIYSSTNKVYGDLEWVKYQEQKLRYVAPDFPQGLSEDIKLEFHSPYGCSKGSADQYMLDYARIFGLKTVVFRHSSMFGGRQFPSYDQGWVGWFCQKAIELKEGKIDSFKISGNGKQVRDILYADDMINLYFLVHENIEKVKGNAFNIGGCMENSLSLLELFSILEKELNIKMDYQCLPPRESDQKIFVADISKIKNSVSWEPKICKDHGVKKMLKWVIDINE